MVRGLSLQTLLLLNSVEEREGVGGARRGSGESSTGARGTGDTRSMRTGGRGGALGVWDTEKEVEGLCWGMVVKKRSHWVT